MNLIFTFLNKPGLGDNFRGLISILQIINKIKEKKQINLLVDFSKSKMKNYFLNEISSELLEIEESETFFYGDEKCHDEDIINFLLNNNSDSIRISTNNYPDINNINDTIKNDFKNILNFTPDFNNNLYEHLNKLPNKYHLYHFRFGDNKFVTKRDFDILEVQKFIKLFNEKKKDGPCVVISDSLFFKKYINKLFKNKNVFVFLNKPTHTFLSKNMDSEDEINILLDFMLMTKAETINCYSFYPWISNFILWTSYIYDVPLFNMKK
uniref:Uncharacterized protein n=1 Tax=viral metagenome TaxID=1070528 RepID=A0A6C0KPM8_9ZZZZ